MYYTANYLRQNRICIKSCPIHNVYIKGTDAGISSCITSVSDLIPENGDDGLQSVSYRMYHVAALASRYGVR